MLDACERLLGLSVVENDLEALVRECSRHGDTETLERVIESRQPSTKVGKAASVAVVQLLLQYLVPIDADALFDHAISARSLDLVQYLLTKGLKHVQIQELRNVTLCLGKDRIPQALKEIMSQLPLGYETTFPDR